MARSYLVPVARRPGYEIHLEQVDSCTFVHLEFNQPWSRELKRAVTRDLDTIFEMHGGPLHALTMQPHNGDVQKHAKFCEMVGFHYLMHVPCTDGVERAVYTRKE